jgi:inner membrane protein
MDSLTQLTLGAAMGEVVAGKKLGNKAMLWGALAGTIPDLDIIAYAFMDDIHALAFHRGLSHSIFFSLLAPFLFALFGRWLYQKDVHLKPGYRLGWRLFWIGISVGMIGLCGWLLFSSFSTFTAMLFIAIVSMAGLWLFRAFVEDGKDFEMPSYGSWYLIFFLGFVTHILIDVFTTYGTQVFQPFHDYRMSTSNISVVDPLYTMPLLFCLFIASLKRRKTKGRRNWLKAGLYLSSFYMLLTFINKININNKFEARLDRAEIEYKDYMTTPTIFNNILWHGVVETDSHFVESYYSLLDKKPPFEDLKYWPKNWHMIAESGCEQSETIEILKWFSNGYYTLKKRNGKYYFNDMRYGTIWTDNPSKEAKHIFYFELDQDCKADERRGGQEESSSDFLKQFIERVKGE